MSESLSAKAVKQPFYWRKQGEFVDIYPSRIIDLYTSIFYFSLDNFVFLVIFK